MSWITGCFIVIEKNGGTYRLLNKMMDLSLSLPLPIQRNVSPGLLENSRNIRINVHTGSMSLKFGATFLSSIRWLGPNVSKVMICFII